MSASSSSDAGVSIAAQPHQGSGTRNGRTMCGALMRSHTNAANLHATHNIISPRRLQGPYTPACKVHTRNRGVLTLPAVRRKQQW